MRVLAGLLALATLPTASAQATSVTYVDDGRAERLWVVDREGRADDLDIALRNADVDVIERRQMPLEARGGCRQLQPWHVRCDGSPRISVRAGGGDDRVVVSLRWPSVGATVIGGDGDDRLAGATFISGGPGDDLVRGAPSGADLHGDEGADRLTGGDGDDALTGGPGRDELNGGDGRDMASWYDAPSGVVADLARRRARQGGVTERLESIERLSGTRHADRLSGDDRPNVLLGGDGADVLRGQGGADRIDLSGRLGPIDRGDRATDRPACGDGDDLVVDARGEAIPPDCERLTMRDGSLWFNTIRVQPIRLDRMPVVCTEESRSCRRRVTIRDQGRLLGRSRLTRVEAGVSTLPVQLVRPLPAGGTVAVHMTGPRDAFRYRLRLP